MLSALLLISASMSGLEMARYYIDGRSANLYAGLVVSTLALLSAYQLRQLIKSHNQSKNVDVDES